MNFDDNQENQPPASITNHFTDPVVSKVFYLHPEFGPLSLRCACTVVQTVLGLNQWRSVPLSPKVSRNLRSDVSILFNWWGWSVIYPHGKLWATRFRIRGNEWSENWTQVAALDSLELKCHAESSPAYLSLLCLGHLPDARRPLFFESGGLWACTL